MIPSRPCYTRLPREDIAYAPLLNAYKTHLLQERGLHESDKHIKVAASFLTLLDDRHPLKEISAAHIQTFITEQGRHYQRKTTAMIACHLA